MREKILTIAQEQLQSGGYENLNFATIAESLSTSRANLHHHFKNKEGLALEATRHYADAMLQNMKQMASAHDGNIITFLAEFEKFMIAKIKEDGCGGSCICSQIIREEDVPQSIRDLSEAHFLKVTSLFKEIIKESQNKKIILKTIAPERLAMMTFSFIMGVGQMALVRGNDPKFIKSLKGLMQEWINRYKI
jgi:TetR/AcrR family transcriptional regulator, transcriptional repressor for nem operon